MKFSQTYEKGHIMQAREHAHLFSQMSNRAFDLYLTDMDTLRNKYGRVQIDIPKTLIGRMKRPQLVNALLADEFSAEAVMDYISQCKEWDEMKSFVENRA